VGQAAVFDDGNAKLFPQLENLIHWCGSAHPMNGDNGAGLRIQLPAEVVRGDALRVCLYVYRDRQGACVQDSFSISVAGTVLKGHFVAGHDSASPQSDGQCRCPTRTRYGMLGADKTRKVLLQFQVLVAPRQEIESAAVQDLPDLLNCGFPKDRELGPGDRSDRFPSQ